MTGRRCRDASPATSPSRTAASTSAATPRPVRRIATSWRAISPVGVKGLGEIGVVGVPAAIANAVYHATGRRIRSLPITIDRLLARGA